MNEEERTLLANVIRSLTAAVTLNIPLDEGELGEVESLVNRLRNDGEEEKPNESGKDLLSALKMIREECKKHNNCPTCPLRNRFDGCSMDGARPEGWLFKNERAEDGVVPRFFD